jgi:hypothetical protein
MAQTILAVMRQKRNTYAWFQQNNPVLADGQIGFINAGQYKNCFKIGDGVTAWNGLSWVTDYSLLFNKPSINGVPISGNVSPNQLGIASSDALNTEAQTRANADTTLQGNIDAEATARANADSAHAALTAAHGSTATPANNRIAMYGSSGGLKSDKAPAEANDVARKTEMDAEAQARANADSAHAALTAAHGSTATPTANTIAMYNSDKGLKSDKIPIEDNDVARKIEWDNMKQVVLGIVRVHRIITERAPIDPMIIITEREGMQLRSERAIL